MSQPTKAKILIVDDEAPIRDVLSASLADENYEVRVAKNGEEGLRMLGEFSPHVVLLDIWMPGSLDGIDVLREGRPKNPTSEFIVMSGHGTIETAVKATKLGAWDFVEKPLSMDKIFILLTNILAFQQERGEKTVLLNRLRRNIALIGESQAMMSLKQMIARVAPTNSWVLITGENGTGKEIVAQNIHYLSVRAGRPFVEVNCAAIPEDLIESELFGYEKGAFTGATTSKKGKFDLANGGTLFLDEVGDMHLSTQAKVLRILQERRFERVGGTESIEVDVRVVAATNKDLKKEIKEGRFREDLYHRLNVIPFHIPPLRERSEDIPALIQHFAEYFSRESGSRVKQFSKDAMMQMQSYNWPGNVRELKNFVERLYILTPGDEVAVHDLKFAGLNQPENGFDSNTTGISNFKVA
ncbi:MAG TPA: sigma-54 dependent transcriptional regulator, partial [Bdellovibrionales bacterium]|nr:sigma-54 dependent transcriptional regulator [Bdellovibrionales bacterium]